MLKNFAGDYLSFDKKERRGTLFLLVLILLSIAAPFTFPFFIKEKKYDTTAFAKAIDSLKIQQADSSNRNYNDNNYHDFSSERSDSKTRLSKGELFYFDPNTLDEKGWVRLGVREKTAAGILKYISKGGRFRHPEDIDKIWGLSDYDKDRLRPYIQIKESFQQPQKEQYSNTTPRYEKPGYTKSVIDINLADTTAYIALPGIGSKLAQRIINFRDKLGGFISIEQVGETFGLPDSTFQKIKPRLTLGGAIAKQLNINKASADELKAHPYIRYAIANAIVQYRTQHGNFASIADVRKIMIITDEMFAKFSPYIKVE